MVRHIHLVFVFGVCVYIYIFVRYICLKFLRLLDGLNLYCYKMSFSAVLTSSYVRRPVCGGPVSGLPFLLHWSVYLS